MSFAWFLVGGLLGAGGMYVAGKEGKWKPNPVDDDGPLLQNVYRVTVDIENERATPDRTGTFELGNGRVTVKAAPHKPHVRVTGIIRGRSEEEALDCLREDLGVDHKSRSFVVLRLDKIATHEVG
jgi:hypothetical protein